MPLEGENVLFKYNEVVIGQWLEFDFTLNLYPSSTHAVTYTFVGESSSHSVEVVSNADESYTFKSEVEGEPGDYRYQGVAVENSTGRKFYFDSGIVTYVVDFASLPLGHDNRSHVKKVLDALEAMIEGKAGSDQIYYMIEGRALSRIPPNELMLWYEKYKIMYANELRKERLNKGKVTGKILVGFR